jgi:hypothetical protein
MKKRKVHIWLQGKGGCGKSLGAWVSAESIARAAHGPLVCIDTDPVNATFSGYEAFKARRIELLDNGVIDSGRFDALCMSIVTEDADFVVDNGSSCFIPLTKYLFESDALSVITGMQREVVFHTVVTGGSALRDTVAGFDWLAEHMPAETQIVLWENEFFGPIQADGRGLREMRAFKKHEHRIAALLRMPKQYEQTFGRDLKAMLDRKMTFAEAKASPDFNIFAKQRITMMERQFLDQLSLVI